MGVYYGSWVDVSRGERGAVDVHARRIVAEHQKITKVEIYMKHRESSFPATPEVTILPATGDTYITSNKVFELSGTRPVQWMKIDWTYSDSDNDAFVRNVEFGMAYRREK